MFSVGTIDDLSLAKTIFQTWAGLDGAWLLAYVRNVDLNRFKVSGVEHPRGRAAMSATQPLLSGPILSCIAPGLDCKSPGSQSACAVFAASQSF
jgi:hypothetical protein